MRSTNSPRIVALQTAYWRDVDEAHFDWQTENPYIAGTEAALLGSVEVKPGERILEIGCGEGANLRHLLRRAPDARYYAVDFSLNKVRFARDRLKAATAVADGALLPFCGGSFDAVFVRDVLHHVPDRSAVLNEAVRILKPGGRLTLIEPNRRNPLIALMAVAIPEERGMLASTRERLVGEVGATGARIASVEPSQPFPISRLVLHYR